MSDKTVPTQKPAVRIVPPDRIPPVIATSVPPPPKHVELPASRMPVTFSWNPVAGAISYEILDRTSLIGITQQTHFMTHRSVGGGVFHVRAVGENQKVLASGLLIIPAGVASQDSPIFVNLS